MIKLTVMDVLRECDGTLFCGDEQLVLTHFSKDTRTIEGSDVYLGIQGDNFDGNSFYREALKKGASCCILDKFVSEDYPKEFLDRTIILVDDTIEAIQKLAAYKRSLVDIPVIAVTGSAGKTSTKDMIAEVLKQKYHVLKTPGNLNGQIGLPMNILELQDEEVMVLEMGMNDFGQISKLTQIAKPTIGVITNIGTAHIGILGSRENILKAKLELLEGMKKGSSLVINYDNDLLCSLNLPNYKLHNCSIVESNEYYVSDMKIETQSSLFQVCYRDQKYSIMLPAMGSAFVMDSLLAIAVGDLLKLSQEQIQIGLKNFKLTGNRMEIISCKDDITIINDTYNSNYEALESALDILKRIEGKRKIAVLGDVLELDDYASEIHHKIGLIPDLKKVDLLFLQGNFAKYIKEGALELGFAPSEIFYFTSKEELEDALIKEIHSGDTILVKASNGMKFKDIVEKLKESYLM